MSIRWLVDPDASTITVLELVEGAYVKHATIEAEGTCEVSVPTAFSLDATGLLG